MTDGGPIFIGGLDRSGKTPLRLMLGSHPRLALTRRIGTWTEFYNRYGDLGKRENFERCMNAMLARPAVQALRPDPGRIAREFWQGEPTYARLFALLHEHYAACQGRSRWGEQLASVERYADPIFAAYPGARMIHMIRDPRERFAAAQSGRRPRRGKAGWETARWVESARLALRNHHRYPGRYLVLRCESLVEDPEMALRVVCSHIGEDFRLEMLTLEGAIRFGGSEAGAGDEAAISGEDAPDGAPQPAQAGLSATDSAFIERFAGRYLRLFHYPPGGANRTARLPASPLDWPANLAGWLAYSLQGLWPSPLATLTSLTLPGKRSQAR